MAILKSYAVFSELVSILTIIQPLAYHVNGSVRGRLAIEQTDLDWLNRIYD